MSKPLFFIFLLTSSYLSAQNLEVVDVLPNNFVSDRIGMGVNSEILSKNQLQIESGFGFNTFGYSTHIYIAPNPTVLRHLYAKGTNLQINASTLRFAVSKRVELRAGFNISQGWGTNNIDPSIGGFTTSVFTIKTFESNLNIGAKIKLFENKKWIPEVSFLANVGYQNQSTKVTPAINGLTNFSAETSPIYTSLIFKNKLSDRFNVRYSLGYSANIHIGKGDVVIYEQNYFDYSLSFDYLLPNNNIKIFAGIQNQISRGGGLNNLPTLKAGAAFKLNDRITLDIFGGAQYNHKQNESFNSNRYNYFGNVGLTWKLHKPKK